MEIEAELKHFIVQNFLYGQDDNSLTEHDSFLEKGIIDSTGVLELVSFVEEKFNVKVKDEEMIPENLDSINNLVKFIKSKQNGGSGA